MFQHFSKYLQRKPGGSVIDFSGIWVNELGSEMALTVQEDRGQRHIQNRGRESESH